MRIDVERGTSADALLADGQFRSDCARLVDECPWATPMQSHAFADAWYTTYRARFEPVLITSRDDEGRLNGLLALAYAPKHTLIPVGGHQAEYQCWISTPALGETFGRDALRVVRKQFPSARLTFRYLPPDVPLAWLAEAPDLAAVSMLTPWKRPLMRLDSETINQRFTRKNIRTRLNKLQRMGYAGIEQITDADRWEPMFDQFIGYHDMRRIAVSGNAPFTDDPLKKQFHLELMRRGGPLCVTVLKVGDEVVSAQLDVVGSRDAHLALGAYAPWMSRHAVGKIHVIELARMMKERGCQRVDLTPGDDPYKADFATEWDAVQVFTCHPSRLALRFARLGRWFERLGRHVLQKRNTTPARTRMLLGEWTRRPLAALAGATLAARDAVWSRDHTLIYVRPAVGGKGRNSNAPETDAPALLRRNSIPDVMAYRPGALGMPVHAYMSQASDRLAQGMSVYTHAEGGQLRCAGWVAEQIGDVLDEGTCASRSLPERCSVVFDVQFFRGCGADVTERAMQQLVLEAERQATGAGTVIVLVPKTNVAQRRIVEQMGFDRARSSARAAGLNSLRKPPVTEMVALMAVAASLVLWCLVTVRELGLAEQQLMPVTADIQEIL